jgi:hypothetical protein
MDRRFDQALSVPHPPYDQAVFAAAIRDVHLPSGWTMQGLMPRYKLSDAHLQAVSAYLKTLSNAWSPGVNADSFAQTAPASAPTNSHKTFDQKARDCRKAGADKQLTGDELRAFVAACIAPPKATTN